MDVFNSLKKKLKINIVDDNTFLGINFQRLRNQRLILLSQSKLFHTANQELPTGFDLQFIRRDQAIQKNST
ncbi:hypothetical protein DERP_005387 [Dermatophagoides pteronyssinus]|uniref:Uncharacterized protein n=1 Tax=Dermatophagoides pteronyssinus TaxID=6956 RepID=A0ABQ8JN81_DERPT|nr:hypothetical protein DERP_005387 [Dermatophagoides pteronyssinus]